MANWSKVNVSQILKVLYPKGVSEVLAPECAAFKLLKKDPDALRGEYKSIVVQHTGSAGASADFATAQSNKNPSKFVKFMVDAMTDYAVDSIDGKLIAQAKGNSDALVNGVKAVSDSLIYTIGRNIASNLYGDGSGTIGVIATGSDVSTTTITLANATDVIRFEPNDKVQLWDGSSSTPRDSGATVTIVSVDPDNGTITADAAWNTISGAAVSDHIIKEGNFFNVATGFAGWLPDTAPGSTDNFFGVNRSVNPNRLAGVRVDGSGSNVDEALVMAANKVAMYGGRPDTAFINHMDFMDVVISRQSHLQIKDGTNTTHLGFESFKILGPAGVIEVFPDAYCPKGKAYLLTRSTWTIGSADPVPQFIDNDGSVLDRHASEDAFEIRLRAYWNLYCNAPGHNAVVKF